MTKTYEKRGEWSGYEINKTENGFVVTDYESPIEQAKQIYDQMKIIYDNGNSIVGDYFAIAKKYANLITKTVNSKGYSIDSTWRINDNTYTMYNSFNEKRDYLCFAEDCAMMVYRLNGGQGHNTMSLLKEID